MLKSVSLVALIVAIIAVWRVTHLLWGEDGPGDIFVRLRRAAGDGFWGGLLDCFYCLSLWIAAPLAWVMGDSWLDQLVLWLGLSGGAILLERCTSKPSAPPPALWQKKEEDEHVVLR